MLKQMDFVRGYSDLRSERIPEIQVQIDDILSFFGAVTPMNGFRKKHTMQVLFAVQGLAIQLYMRMKHYCWMPRPADFAHEVQPIIQTPDHSSFPAGHAVEAFAIATVLHFLSDESASKDMKFTETLPMVFRVAHRIAVNRTIAGVHSPIDNAAGAAMGYALGRAIIALATASKDDESKHAVLAFGIASFQEGQDFDRAWVTKTLNGSTQGNAVTAETIPLFTEHFSNARVEWGTK
ncbi:phosphatase PAP2 family protein [Planktotalea sp.]|uniref:phosphatase PAP2 family protein n=1 Tax=Planktotalea sp. TaxID=2029877 RepID=UPI0032971F68